ncbi:ATP-binding protein [Eubacterium callanderi]|uniref:ATP-binding protein n=1 Tax=Eubacterium callanderi TaxID=53442 RepID=UPI0034A31CA4
MYFDRFYTTDVSRSRKTTGLGLSIAKRLATRMGGSISASLDNDVFGIHLQFSLK